MVTDLEAMGLPIDQGDLFEMDLQKFTQQLTDTDNATSRRSVFGLLAGVLALAGFAGRQSADARRRGGNGGNGGHGGRGGRGGRGNGRGGRGGRGHNRNNRH